MKQATIRESRFLIIGVLAVLVALAVPVASGSAVAGEPVSSSLESARMRNHWKEWRCMNMRKTVWFISTIVVMALMFLAVGCASSTAKDNPTASSGAPGSIYFPLLEESVKSPYPEETSPYANAVMKTDQDTYSTSAIAIQFTIESLSDHDMMTGEPYSLEIFRDNAWHTVPFKKPSGNVVRAWSAVGILIPTKGVLSGSIRLTEHVPLIAGRYRLVKEILTQDRKDYWGNAYIWAEFNAYDSDAIQRTTTDAFHLQNAGDSQS